MQVQITKKRRGPFEDFKKLRKKSHKAEKGRGKSHSAEKLEGGPFWVLHFKVEAFGCVQNQVLSTFGKSESFTKSGTYAMSEKSDEKKRKLATVIVELFSLEKRRLKNNAFLKIIFINIYATNHQIIKQIS